MAQDVELFMKDHGLQKPALIGHSMGAKVAMTLALRNPSLISALIPVDNAPIDAALASSFGTYIKGMREIEAANLAKQSDADAILQPYESSLPIRQFLLTNLVRSPETNTLRFRIPIKTLAAALDHMADFPFRDPEEARFEGPTLVIRGTKSKYVADEALPVIGRFFPKFEVVDVESGHWVMSEKPEEFRKAVVEFLQRQG